MRRISKHWETAGAETWKACGRGMGRDEIGNEDLHTTRLHRPPNVMFSKVFVGFFFLKDV